MKYIIYIIMFVIIIWGVFVLKLMVDVQNTTNENNSMVLSMQKDFMKAVIGNYCFNQK